jgi:hypothetical protein
MAKLLAVAAALAVSLLAQPAVAAPRTDARSAARGFAKATLTARERLSAARGTGEDVARPGRIALHDCLDECDDVLLAIDQEEGFCG